MRKRPLWMEDGTLLVPSATLKTQFYSMWNFLVLWFFCLCFCKLGHRCFIAAKCFETFSYVQWEKMPLKIHAEIIKLFNFTVNLSEQVINLSLYCLLLHTCLFSPFTFSDCLRVPSSHRSARRRETLTLYRNLRPGHPRKGQLVLPGSGGSRAVATAQQHCAVATDQTR